MIVEGHLGCDMDLACDIVIVLRTKPSILKNRLSTRKYAPEKVKDNVMSEMLDYSIINACEHYVNVYELDTTTGSSEKTASEVIKILNGKGCEFAPGKINWSDELEAEVLKN